jgi:hypothetical protein
MFNNTRHTSHGINVEIPAEIVSALWTMVDNLKQTGFEIDYLHVFRLSSHGDEQHIIHSQEQPAYKNEVSVRFMCEPIRQIKIYIIDNGSYTTMMLATEY